MKLKYILALAIGLIATSGCKESNDDKVKFPDNEYGWVYEAMQDDYLWAAKLPAYKASSAEMERYYETLRYRYNKGVSLDEDYHGDRFSYITTKDDTRSIFGHDTKNDLGMYFVVMPTVDKSQIAYVTPTVVVKGSPADIAGIRRGYIIKEVNGIACTGVNYTSSNFNAIAKALSSGTININYSRTTSDMTTYTASISQAEYRRNPYLCDSVYNSNNGRIGYIAYNNFPTEAESAAEYFIEMKNIFQRFKDEGGISHLVVDLRYNGGGGLVAAQQMASLIAPPASLTQNFTLLEDGSGNFQAVRFLNTSDIQMLNPDISKVVFITTNSSASASEMVIHCLKPYFSTNALTVVGERSYGKNVGGFAKESDKYNWKISMIAFRVHDKNKVSDYQTGIPATAGHSIADMYTDYPVYNLGDTKEVMLRQALSSIDSGTYPSILSTRAARAQSLPIIGMDAEPETLYIDRSMLSGE